MNGCCTIFKVTKVVYQQANYASNDILYGSAPLAVGGYAILWDMRTNNGIYTIKTVSGCRAPVNCYCTANFQGMEISTTTFELDGMSAKHTFKSTLEAGVLFESLLQSITLDTWHGVCIYNSNVAYVAKIDNVALTERELTITLQILT